MKYITLKDTDLNLSNLCFGTAGFGEKLNKEQSFELLDAFVRRGGNFIDTANVYCRWIPGLDNCSEKFLGEWLKSRGAYKDVVIATKGAHYLIDDVDKHSRVNEYDIRVDLEESLAALGVDVIDFYWLHRDDPSRPIEEIVDILEGLRAEGKIRYYGLSNYKTDRIKRAKEYLESKGLKGPYAVSNQWSLAAINPGKNTNPDPTLVEFSSEEYEWHIESQVPVIPFSSTAMGFFEKLKRAGVVVKNGELKSVENLETIPLSLRDAYWSEKNLRIYEKLLMLQVETGHSLQALSAAYLLNQPFQVIPIGSARTEEQLEGFLEASDIVIPAERF
ncbi:aldo/keto reductase [Blautia schinkii]|nr:aldo/keto reductase [Blautia schinkii]